MSKASPASPSPRRWRVRFRVSLLVTLAALSLLLWGRLLLKEVPRTAVADPASKQVVEE